MKSQLQEKILHSRKLKFIILALFCVFNSLAYAQDKKNTSLVSLKDASTSALYLIYKQVS